MGDKGTVLHACRDQGGARPLLSGAQAIPVLPAGSSPLTVPGLRLQAGFLGVHTHLSTAAIPLAPAQKPPALPHVPFGESPRFIYACASTSCRHGRAGWGIRRRMRGHAPSALHQDALTACPARRRAFRRRPLRGPGFPLRRPSFFRQGGTRRLSDRNQSRPLTPGLPGTGLPARRLPHLVAVAPHRIRQNRQIPYLAVFIQVPITRRLATKCEISGLVANAG